MNSRLDFGAYLIARNFEVIGRLHAHPEFGACAKVAGQPEGCVRRDCALAIDDLADAYLRDTDRLRQRILREMQWLQKVLAQNLAWMCWWKIGHCSGPLNDSRRSRHRGRRRCASGSRCATGH